MSFLQQYASFKFINHIVGLNMASGQYTFPFTLDEARQIDPGFNIDNFYKLYPEKWSYEDYMIAKVGKKIYELVFKPYSENFWGCEARHLNQSLGRRVSLRDSKADYFNDKYVGLPTCGFKQMIQHMLKHPKISIVNRKANYWLFHNEIVYVTSSIDNFFDYRFGKLRYVNVSFDVIEETRKYRRLFTDKGLYTVNHINTHMDVLKPVYYRSSNMYMHYGNDGLGIVAECVDKDGGIDTHPLLDAINSKHPLYEKLTYRLSKYTSLADSLPNLKFCGRLGTYKYMDIDKCVKEALKITENI